MIKYNAKQTKKTGGRGQPEYKRFSVGLDSEQNTC